MNSSLRVDLVAMSGVRVRSAELLARGMTLPGFVERSRVIASLPSLSLLTLAGATPPEWEVTYHEVDSEPLEAAADRLDAGAPDLVALSSFTARIGDTYRLADLLRERGRRVVLGGLHVSAIPDEAAAHADAIMIGESENTWPLLLADARAGRLRPVYRATDAPPVDLGTVPMARFDLLDIDRYNRLTIQTARGCPHHCDFCGASRTISPYRLKPIDRVRAELEAVLALWPRPFIELADDNTFVARDWSRELVRLFSEYRLRWFTETDISVADDPELLDLLAESGCAQLLIGLESPRPEALDGIDSKNWKLRRLDTYLRDIERIQSRGISVNGCFILGHDSDDTSVFGAVRDFVRAAGLAEVQITLKTPFPATTFRAQLEREGRLLPGVGWDSYTLFDVTFVPARMSAPELEAGFHQLMQDIYSESETTQRRRILNECLRTSAERRQAGIPGPTA